jgi:hypothetical protein
MAGMADIPVCGTGRDYRNRSNVGFPYHTVLRGLHLKNDLETAGSAVSKLKSPVSVRVAKMAKQIIEWLLWGAEGDPNCCADQDCPKPSTFNVSARSPVLRMQLGPGFAARPAPIVSQPR